MKLHPAVLGAIAVAVAATCLAAGFWQLSRLRTKQALNAARRAALASPPAALAASPAALAAQAGRKVEAGGEYEPARHVLLSARFHDGELGVEVLTPLRTAAGVTLLVDRGWLAADDGQNAAPESLAEAGERRVVGVLEPIAARAGMPPWRRLDVAGAEHWSTHELDSAAVATHLPGVLPTALLVALPDPAAPAALWRTGPPLLETEMHASYAIQWFSFAAVTIVGSLALALRRRRATTTHRP